MVRKLIGASELKTASVEAYRESDPIKRLEFEVQRQTERVERIEATQTATEARIKSLQVKGVQNHYQDNFVAVNGLDQPETKELSWVINGVNHYSDGDQIDLLRPADGVTDESLGTIVDDGLGSPEATTFETFCEFGASPSITRISPSDGSTATLVESVDYTEDLINGTITIIPAGTNIAIGDQIYMTATFVGTWSISLVGDEDGNLFFLRGFTQKPSNHWFEVYGNRTDVALITVVRSVSDVSVLAAADVDTSGNEYVAQATVNRFFDYLEGHQHTGDPNDAPQLGLGSIDQEELCRFVVCKSYSTGILLG